MVDCIGVFKSVQKVKNYMYPQTQTPLSDSLALRLTTKPVQPVYKSFQLVMVSYLSPLLVS